MPAATQQLAIANSAHNNSTHNHHHHHHKSAGSWMESERKPKNNDDHFSSHIQSTEGGGFDESFNKYTRQRERASRSLDKY